MRGGYFIYPNGPYANFASFPAVGTPGVIYVDLALNDLYLWTGAVYEQMNGGGGGGTWDSLTGSLTTTSSFWSQMPDFPTSLNYFIEEFDYFPVQVTTATGNLYSPTAGASSAVQPADASESFAGINSTEKAIGVTRLNTGTTATGRAGLGWGGAQGLASFKIGIVEMIFGIRQNIAVLPTVTENFTVWTGFVDIVTAQPTNGVYFRYNYAVNGGRWEYCTTVAGATTAADTGVSPSATVYQIMEIKINAAGTSVTFYIDGSLVGTITTGLPTVGLLAMTNCLKSAGTGQPGNVPIDAMFMATERLATR